MKDNSVLIIGGDSRLRTVYNVLKSKGIDCEYENSDGKAALKKASDYRYLALPVPAVAGDGSIFSDNRAFKLSTDSLGSALSQNHIVFGGAFGKELSAILDERNAVYIDFCKNEDFLSFNAFLTSQGTLCLLTSLTSRLLTGEKALITGFGRVSKALALTLKGISMKVCICARSESQLSLARAMGFDAIPLCELKKKIGEYPYIFNTVPENIFSDDVLAAFDPRTLYIELASAPYGIKKELFDSERFIPAPALPGRYVSQSAGEKIAELILKHI